MLPNGVNHPMRRLPLLRIGAAALLPFLATCSQPDLTPVALAPEEARAEARLLAFLIDGAGGALTR